MTMRTITPGTCKFCGCMEMSACVLPNGDPCSWLDMSRTVCNAPACIRQNADLIRRILRGSRRRSPAEIEALKLAERRAARAGYRAAAKMRASNRARSGSGGGRP